VPRFFGGGNSDVSPGVARGCPFAVDFKLVLLLLQQSATSEGRQSYVVNETPLD
jgi:hypothetical protein